MIIGGLEGAMLVARLHGDPSRFRAATDRLLADVAGAHGRKVSGAARPRGAP